MAAPKHDDCTPNGVSPKPDTNGTSSTHMSHTSFDDPGPTTHDFRSDTLTRPSTSMLSAIATCHLGDDVFHEDKTTSELESWIAAMTGKEAALLVLSGTMGNQLCLRSLLSQPPHGVLADSRSHIFQWEAGSLASLSGAWPQMVTPRNGRYLTLDDVKKHTVMTDDDHKVCTRVISLENTLGGNILPLSDCRAIADWARGQDPPICIHLDGARLWEAVTALAASSCRDGSGRNLNERDERLSLLKDYAQCFDSLSLCFSKGLGAPIGSIICSSSKTIAHARHVRKSIGGGLRQAGIISAPAAISVRDTFMDGKLRRVHDVARRISKMWIAQGGKLIKGHEEVETNMVWLDLDAAGVSGKTLVRVAESRNVRVGPTGRIVVHYQIDDEAVQALEATFIDIFKGTPSREDS